MDVETKFLELPGKIRKHEKDYDAKEEILKARIILDDAKESGKHWIMAWEVCNKTYTLSNGFKINCTHRMPARLTDCYQQYPDLYAARRVGRYVAYRAK